MLSIEEKLKVCHKLKCGAIMTQLLSELALVSQRYVILDRMTTNWYLLLRKGTVRREA